MDENRLSIWTVYERPLDYPNQYVARRWLATPELEATNDRLFADDLEGLRKQMPPGLVIMPRDASDDPVIVESWI